MFDPSKFSLLKFVYFTSLIGVWISCIVLFCLHNLIHVLTLIWCMLSNSMSHNLIAPKMKKNPNSEISFFCRANIYCAYLILNECICYYVLIIGKWGYGAYIICKLRNIGCHTKWEESIILLIHLINVHWK